MQSPYAYSTFDSSHNGYALAKAVFSRHKALLDLLLQHGANPSVNGWIATSFAVKQKDLALTERLLVSQDGEDIRDGTSERLLRVGFAETYRAFRSQSSVETFRDCSKVESMAYF